MTGLLRTSFLFFLPVFLALFLYHSWVSDPYAREEARSAFLDEYKETIKGIEVFATKNLHETGPGTFVFSGPLAESSAVLAEGIRDGSPIIRLIRSDLTLNERWTMKPDSSLDPSFLTGFEISSGGSVYRCFLVQSTIYDKDGDPIELNVYLRKGPQKPTS